MTGTALLPMLMLRLRGDRLYASQEAAAAAAAAAVAAESSKRQAVRARRRWAAVV